MSEPQQPKPAEPTFSAAIDNTEPCGKVLRPLAALLLWLAEKRCKEEETPTPEGDKGG